MATNESNVVAALQEQKNYDVFHWVSPSSKFIAANDITDYFMVYIREISGGCQFCDEEASEGSEGHMFDECNDASSKKHQKQKATHEGVETLFVTLQMMHMGQPITPLLPSSHTRGDAHTLNEWTIFPIAVCDVPLDAVVECRVYSRHGHVGCVAFHPFTVRGELKTGRRCYRLQTAAATAAPRKAETPRWERLARDLHHGLMQSVPWMDKLVERRLAEMRRVQDEVNSNRDGNTPPKEDRVSLNLFLTFPVASNRLPIFMLSVPHEVSTAAQSFPLAATPTQPFIDLCINDENLCELRAHTVSKSLFLISDADAQPGPLERRQLQEIARRPLIQLEELRIDDEIFLWRFRFFLTRDPSFFVLFMRCVNWKNKAERQEALKLMQQWKPISFAQALVCLSIYFSGVVHVRNYAIGLLERQPDERILRFLLQLVQAVRYDVKGELEQFLLRRALGSWELCSTLFWYIHVETLLERPEDTNQRSGSEQERYSLIMQNLLTALEETQPLFLQRIRRQQKLMSVLRNLYRAIMKDPRDRIKRIELATSLIDMKKCGIQELFYGTSGHVARAADNPNTLTLPTHPCVVVDCIASSGFYMFKSAKMPVRVPFLVQPDCISSNTGSGSGGRSGSGSGGSSNARGFLLSDEVAASRPCFVPLSFPSPEVGVIFKVGDDVRQDQLVVQLVQLIDTMLRQDGLDLCLSPYRVLATGPTEGLVELVPNVDTFQIAQRDITRYIRTHNPTPEAYTAAMGRFTKSVAGYCVLTFILGIGDRHLENILVAHDGRLLHIDFGYILGNDPKPFPPPMKINKEMVEALGGPQSEGYTEFKSYCCSSYNIIRKHAQLILSMMLLMVDASIPQISGDGKLDPRVNLLKVQDKLRLDLSNAQAAQYIQNVIADSVGSIFTNLWDVIHVATQATRH
ncbi:phosphatidylinositol 3-kinase [Trypanosoma grayi]|uniref:phosphatidylinositol 3-kinase n=1 Tax=Trypanosoma grayi TaxID=71804 RepID=UPI0004F457B7|nr:phosphatidylinositol 3-kinase [Trypanosoma grayi]KEG07911.1 phosphatidylinositol 3-kinase [Trypanosoma grayi]